MLVDVYDAIVVRERVGWRGREWGGEGRFTETWEVS